MPDYGIAELQMKIDRQRRLVAKLIVDGYGKTPKGIAASKQLDVLYNERRLKDLDDLIVKTMEGCKNG